MRASLNLVLVACGSTAPSVAYDNPPPPPPDCQVIAPGQALREAARIPDARLCLAPGRHEGPIALAHGTTVWGPRAAVIDRREGGSVVDVSANATLLGATIDGRGGVFDQGDAAVRITGDGARVEGVTITNAVFGVLAERVARVTIRNNRVEGDRGSLMGVRGDTIRLWQTHDSVVSGNVVEGGRDFVMWYSSRNRVMGNRVSDGRYGMHFMYSHHNHVAKNHYVRDVVGVFVMYSHDVELVDNVVRDAGGSAGMAVGLKDAGNIVVQGNAFIQDHIGIFIDNSPVQLSHSLTVAGNLFGRCDTAIVLHGGGRRSRFEANDFIENAALVRVESGGDSGDILWANNYWSEYAGYDLDGDHRGDIGYEVRSLEGDLVDRTPALAFFHATPALLAAEAVTQLVPMYAARTLLIDASPRMQPHSWEGIRED